MSTSPIILTKISSAEEKPFTHLMIESLQAFGGSMSRCPVWIFATDDLAPGCADLSDEQVQVIPLSIPTDLQGYPFSSKVLACARAEELAPAGAGSLIWLDSGCLVVQPPELYDLNDDIDAAFRPVHIRNVGSPVNEPPDAFWQGVYRSAGVQEMDLTVQPFIGTGTLRAYFNSHGFSVRAGLGIFNRWAELFTNLVRDAAFQTASCQDELHRIFLFQAVLSTLVGALIPPQRIRILPPAYNYPYHLQKQVLVDRRAQTLNELVTFAIEETMLVPDRVKDIDILEPLRSWLQRRAAAFQA